MSLETDELDVEGRELTATLEAWCEANGYRVRFGMIDATAVAAILGRAVGTLKNWQRNGVGPPCRRGGYLLRDVADFLLAERE